MSSGHTVAAATCKHKLITDIHTYTNLHNIDPRESLCAPTRRYPVGQVEDEEAWKVWIDSFRQIVSCSETIRLYTIQRVRECIIFDVIMRSWH